MNLKCLTGTRGKSKIKKGEIYITESPMRDSWYLVECIDGQMGLFESKRFEIIR